VYSAGSKAPPGRSLSYVIRLAIACWWACVRQPGDEVGRGRRSVSLRWFRVGVRVSESEPLLVSDRFGAESTGDGGDHSMWSSLCVSVRSEERGGGL
jgi:hypothetical protein